VKRLGGYDTSGYAHGVQVVGTVAYVADGGAGLQILDVSNPAQVKRLGGYDTSGYAHGVQVVGTVAYVADGEACLQILGWGAVNNAPVLAVIGDNTVYEGSLLTFMATATDTDIPAQSLTFSLESGAPAGASITAGGLFTWTPTDAQGPSTNLITIKVTDNGTPSMSATQSFMVVVKEIYGAPRWVGTKLFEPQQFQATLSGEAGACYIVEVSTNLVHWSAAVTNTVDSQGRLEFTETMVTGIRQKFYRARLAP
jgi:hypothetical protein